MTLTKNTINFERFITNGLGFTRFKNFTTKQVFSKILDDGRICVVEYLIEKNIFRSGHIDNIRNYKTIEFLAWQEFNSSVIMLDGVLMEGLVNEEEVWKSEDYRNEGIIYYDHSNAPDYFYKITNITNEQKNIDILCDDEKSYKGVLIHRPKAYVFHQQPFNLKLINFVFSNIKQTQMQIEIIQTMANGMKTAYPYCPDKFCPSNSFDPLKINISLPMIMNIGTKIRVYLLPKQSIELTLYG